MGCDHDPHSNLISKTTLTIILFSFETISFVIYYLVICGQILRYWQNFSVAPEILEIWFF